MTTHPEAPESSGLEHCPYCGKRKGVLTTIGWIGEHKDNEFSMCITCLTHYTIGEDEARWNTKRSMENGQAHTLPGW